MIVNDAAQANENNVQEWTTNGPVAKPCYNCQQPASYWAADAVWLCVEHWEAYFEACRKVTPTAPNRFPSDLSTLTSEAGPSERV